MAIAGTEWDRLRRLRKTVLVRAWEQLNHDQWPKLFGSPPPLLGPRDFSEVMHRIADIIGTREILRSINAAERRRKGGA